ncbi:MAG: hypothetical protein LBH38_02115 [Holosporales bacterium]|jgi:hypothetical protein|nr:hypothetical protein [Holosporales bacterium]
MMSAPLKKFYFDRTFEGIKTDASAQSIEEPLRLDASTDMYQHAFEEGRIAGIKEAQETNVQREKTQIQQLLKEIYTILNDQNDFRVEYEKKAAKEYIFLLKDALTHLFPLFEERWGTLETEAFLKDFLKNPPRELSTVRITLPQKLLPTLKKYFSKEEKRFDFHITWTVSEDSQEAPVQVCWENGGIEYARAQLFSEILRVFEAYAHSRNAKYFATKEIKGEEE